MYDLIIVGGGISGLFLYYKLLNTGKKILLLEKNEIFGGRILQCEEDINSHKYSFPKGAGRFNVNHVEVIKLLKELKLLDFRKDKGHKANVEFIDSKNEFSKKFNMKGSLESCNRCLHLF
jgi:protoporphyrinogen oxidase